MNSTEKGFRGDYSFLSNFSYFNKPMVRCQNGVVLTFPTNEHFYVAMKTKDIELREQVGKHPSKGLKKFGRSFPIREDWDAIKLDVMLYGLRYKFSKNNPLLRSKLISTGQTELVEYNYWDDTYWGVCLKTDIGENHLGKLLMQVREEIHEQQ